MQNLLGHMAGVMEQIGVVNSSLLAIPAALTETNKVLEKSATRMAYERPYNDAPVSFRFPYPRAAAGFAAAVLGLLAWIALK